MDFCNALYLLKAGYRVRRAGWNGKGMWLALQKPSNPNQVIAVAPRLGVFTYEPGALSNPTRGTVDTLKVLPYIAMRTADACWVPWLASQTDILADDWEEAD